MYVQLGASNPVSSLLTTISSFIRAGSSDEPAFGLVFVLLGGLAVRQNVLSVGIELVPLVAAGPIHGKSRCGLAHRT